MTRVPSWINGTIIWGDKTLQASTFADDPNPHVNPVPADLDWNSLRADYISQTDAIAQTIASAFGIGGTPASGIVMLVNDNPLGNPITSTAPVVLSVGNTSANKLGVANIQYYLVGSTGVVDLNGQSNPSMYGLNFVPTMSNTGAATTVNVLAGAKVLPRTTGLGSNTITSLIGLEVGFAHLSTIPTVTNAYGVKIDPFGRSTYAAAYGVDIGAITGPTVKVGIREQSTGVNLLSSKTRIGDQTTPTEVLESAANILAATNLKQNTSPGSPVSVGTANSAGSSVLVPALDHVHNAAHPLLDGSLDNDTAAGSVTRGDVIVGNSTPQWKRLGIGPSGQYLRSNGTDIGYSAIQSSDLPPTPFSVQDNGGNVVGSQSTVQFSNNGGVQFQITNDTVNNRVIVAASHAFTPPVFPPQPTFTSGWGGGW